MSKSAILDDRNARYRQRLRKAGEREVLFQLPDKTLAIIDEIKRRQRLRSRSLALLQLIEQGMEAAQ
jgi:hypothetical protein